MTRAFWLDKAWYLAFWLVMLCAARLWLVNPILHRLDRLIGK